MALTTLVGLNVTDDEGYQSYRNAMTPILHRYGGGFSYDFKVSQTLKSRTDAPINRVFLIHFPSMELMETFFADPEYVQVKKAYFEPSVSDTTIIASFEEAIT